MQKKWRFLIEAAVAAIVVFLAVQAYLMAQGMLLTRSYAPDLIEQYAQAEALSNTVQIASWASPSSWFFYAIGPVIGGVMYYGIRYTIWQAYGKK
ncbi:hypothetical protein [Paenibacillus sp. NEAU-GSW1]|uniref:hypothetical protein n=1 Tax=Paenibacillus sp. NEAU-GSW1 TaxID=2682486 RepID=UPI0012E24C67|nr:hypothetical protein [Paenibacillus sp. NEAU-GSW1]MUT65177.1 hypothetical protein [Paenibacillus sp. NEAU-GSW1]